MVANSGVSTSMSAELMHKMNPYGYKKFCSYISERDSISLEFWKASKWVNYFALDTSLTFKNGKVDPNHVYELFGNFNGLSAQEVRMHLLEYIYENIDLFECRSSVCLALCGIGMNTWVDMVEDSRSCCDELALLGLSAMYQRHCLVVTKNKFWSTIETKEPLSIINLMKECSIRLLYLGNLKFGTLHWQPHNPQPVKPQLGQFKIIEEFTLDGPTTSGESSNPDNESEEHVETTNQSESAPPPVNLEETVAPPDPTQQTRKVVQKNTESIPVNVETSDTTNTVKVETPVQTKSGNKSSKTVPCLKDLKVVVQKLDDSVNEESTGSANSPVETELKPIITSVRGYNLPSSRPYEEDTDDNDDEPKHKISKRAHPSRSGQSPERLLAHANALINKVSSFVSKPSNERSNDRTGSNLETSSQTNDQMLPVETSNNTPVRRKPAITIW